MKNIGVVCAMLLFLMLPGCATTMDVEWPDREPNLVEVSYSIADALLERLKTKPIPFSPIVVASFVEAGKPDRPTNLGRIMADFISSRMSMKGLRIVEMRSGEPVRLVRNGSDLILTREGTDPACCQKAQAIVFGTYTKAQRGIYVATRIVRADNQQIISSVDLHIPLSYEMMFLM